MAANLELAAASESVGGNGVESVMVDQTRLDFDTAYESYRRQPSAETGKALIKAAKKRLLERPRDLARYAPTLGIMHTLQERGHWPLNSLRKKIGYYILDRVMQSQLGDPLPPKRPGWNDYYMVRWQLTHEQWFAEEIHRRTHYNDPNMVGFTANWMADSQRQQDPEFDAALLAAEIKCGCKKMHVSPSPVV